ncbi:TMV resistance protein N, partial [Mucuna pruriens]
MAHSLPLQLLSSTLDLFILIFIATPILPRPSTPQRNKKDYASSKWCFDELSKILEVFYNIDPSHVRNQIGSYEQAFVKHEGDPRCNKWRNDLYQAANLAGWDSRGSITPFMNLFDV